MRGSALLLAMLATAGSLAAQGARTDSVVVEVQNERAVPVTVYLKSGRFDRRLAIVPARQTRLLTVPGWAIEGRPGVSLIVQPEGDVDIGTRTFLVRSGDRLSLQIPAAGGLPPGPEDTMSVVLTPEELEATTLTVDNPRNRAITVFAERGQFDVRLGRVPPRERATLQLPKSVVGPDRSVRIFVHPDGGTDLSSSLMRLKAGEHLALRVPRY